MDGYLAVYEVFPEALADPTDATVIAMVYALVGIVIPQLADAAVVASGRLSTLDAYVSSSLGVAANHAQHISGFPPGEHMVLRLIVAKPAGVPFLARKTL